MKMRIPWKELMMRGNEELEEKAILMKHCESDSKYVFNYGGSVLRPSQNRLYFEPTPTLKQTIIY